MHNETAHKKTFLYGIELLRAISCILVVICHTNLQFEKGAAGVDAFMVISGFVTMFSTERRTELFFVKRVVRIGPFYWLMTLITAAFVLTMPQFFNSYEVSGVYLIKSVLFIPYVHSGILQPIMGLGWTLNYEMAFYLVFWGTMCISKKYRGVITSGFWILLFILHKLMPGFLYLDFYGNDIVLEFVYGIIAFYLYLMLSKSEMILRKWFQILVYVIFAAVVTCMVVFANFDIRGLTNGVFAFVALLCVSLIVINGAVGKVVQMIGGATFIVYLIHIYIVRIVEKVLYCVPGIVTMIISVILSITVGVLYNQLIEARVQNWMKTNILVKLEKHTSNIASVKKG